MESNDRMIAGQQYCEDQERELTVRKTSQFCPGDGFGAYDNRTGELAFRVDNYGHGSALNDELMLLEPSGSCILTLRRKRRSLHSRWDGFLGERAEEQKPLFSVRRSSIFCDDRSNVSVEVYGGDGVGEEAPVLEYRVEGSFPARSCRILYVKEEEEVVAMIKRKMVDHHRQVILGRDVFCLYLSPLVDAAFIMGLVIALDQISHDEIKVGVNE